MTSPPKSASFERRAADWLPVPEAYARILTAARTLGAETVPVAESVGRALAESITATATLPPWDNSAMDGFAVRAADVADATDTDPVSLRVVGASRAGAPAAVSVGEGEAVRIMTGAPVPAGADTIVRVEDTDAETVSGAVTIRRGAVPGRHIRGAGQDLADADTLLRPGHVVTPGSVGLLHAAGRATVEVHAAPRVAVLSNGDELRPVERYDEVRAGLGIPDSNGPMVAALVRSAGATPVALGIAADSSEALRAAIETGRDCDVLVTIGGASMGDADLVKRVLDDMGFALDFWRIRMRPGSPLAFGHLTTPSGGRQAVFSLPGNPASAYVTFELFVRPFLRAMSGCERPHRRTLPCRAAEEIVTPADLTYFQRVRVETRADGWWVRLTGEQSSGLVRGLAWADGLAVVPPEVDRIEPGGRVDVIPLDATAWSAEGGWGASEA